jgi:hypothetical protein
MCFPPEDANKPKKRLLSGAQNLSVLDALVRFEIHWRPRYRQASEEAPKTGGFASPPFGGFALKQLPILCDGPPGL